MKYLNWLAPAATLALAGCGATTTVSGPATVTRPTHSTAAETDDVAATRAKLPADERALVEAQEWCANQPDERLGAMGAPIRLDIKGEPVFVCCKSCVKAVEANPDKALATVAELKAKKAASK